MEGYLESCDTLDDRQFIIAVKRLADSLSYGTDKSPFLGSGIEFVQSRQYQPGDPIKSIDWRVTARTGKIFVKEYEAPKRLPVYLLLDTSASMTIRSGKLSKYAWAVQIAGGIAFAALDRVSPVGLIGCGGRELRINPSLSKDMVMQWLYRLRRYRYDETTTLAQTVYELGPSLANRAVVIVLSDMHDPDGPQALRLLGQRHDVVILQLQDPAELNMRGSGIFRGQEAETGTGFVTHGRTAWVDSGAMREDLRRGNIDHLLLPTNQPMEAKLRHFFKHRGYLGRGAR